MTNLTNEQISTAEIAVSIAAELRAHPDHWFKGNLVKFANGRTSSAVWDARSKEAVCWCLIGHIAKRADDPNLIHRDEFARYANSGDYFRLHLWNDEPSRTVEDVISLCNRVSLGYGFAKFRAASLTALDGVAK
jgi:hypothetical protein